VHTPAPQKTPRRRRRRRRRRRAYLYSDDTVEDRAPAVN